MNHFWEDDIDGLHTWDDLGSYLAGRWRQVRDRDVGVVLTTHFDELLVDEPPAGTARQRRRLHQLGLRRRDDRCWSWTPPSPSPGDLPPPPRGLHAAMSAAWTSSQLELAIDRARSGMAALEARSGQGRSAVQ